MPFDFTGRLETSHTPPRQARDLGACRSTNKRRVAVIGDYAASLPPTSPDAEWATTFLYDDRGQCRGADGSGEAFDLVRVSA